jgi:hypothetical protein
MWLECAMANLSHFRYIKEEHPLILGVVI